MLDHVIRTSNRFLCVAMSMLLPAVDELSELESQKCAVGVLRLASKTMYDLSYDMGGQDLFEDVPGSQFSTLTFPLAAQAAPRPEPSGAKVTLPQLMDINGLLDLAVNDRLPGCQQLATVSEMDQFDFANLGSCPNEIGCLVRFDWIFGLTNNFDSI